MAERRRPFYISKLAPLILKPMSRTNTWLLRVSGGRIGGKVAGRAVCLLTTTGRKSGQQRTQALYFVPDGDEVYLVAAQGGLPQHPAWLLNLRDDPHVTVEIDGTSRDMLAREVDDAERTRLWPWLTRHYGGWDRYQSWTDRRIPVVVCSPA